MTGTFAVVGRGLAARYGRREVFHDVSLEVRAGQAVGVVGENGAGAPGKRTCDGEDEQFDGARTDGLGCAKHGLAPLPGNRAEWDGNHGREPAGHAYCPKGQWRGGFPYS